MFVFLFLAMLILFLNIKTIDLGILGKYYYIGERFIDSFRIPHEAYIVIIVLMVIFGLLAFRDIIKPSHKDYPNTPTEMNQSEEIVND